MAKKYKYTTARQVDGDDGYCWAVFVRGKMRVNGLTRREVTYYRERFEREEEAKRKGPLEKIDPAGPGTALEQLAETDPEAYAERMGF